MKKIREIGERVRDLRKARRETQTEFAKALGVTQPMVSGWESGKGEEPSTGAYLRLGNLAAYPDNLWFWEQAGIERQAMLSAVEKVVQERLAIPPSGSFVQVPCVRKSTKGIEPAGRSVSVPREFVANPASTVCLIVDEKTATATVPCGDLIVLDTSQNDAKDLSSLWDNLVLIDTDLSDERATFLQTIVGPLPGGLYLGRLECRPYYLSAPGSGAQWGLSWEAIVGAEGDSQEPWRRGGKGLRIGYISGGSIWKKPEEIGALLKTDRERGLKSVRIDEFFHILGRVLAQFHAPAVKAVSPIGKTEIEKKGKPSEKR